MPLMAEGEFALVQQYSGTAIDKSLGKAGGWIGQHDVYAMLVDAAAQKGDAAVLQKYTPAAEEMAARYNHKLYQAIVHRARGVAHRLAGQYSDAEIRLKQALTLFETLDTRWQIGRTLFELGELALANTESESAREYFSRALVAFEELGALPDATRTQEKLSVL
jgi:tetratricopeptide (TPR) repeat protein